MLSHSGGIVEEGRIALYSHDAQGLATCDATWRSRRPSPGRRAGPPPADRLAAHADAARLRLVCVHAFRPAPEGLLDALLARVGAGAPSCLIFDPEHANV
jgi:hypothetical protein